MLPGEVGLFALRPLKKGTVINKAFACGEKFITKKTYEKLDKITQKMINTYGGSVYDGYYTVPDLRYVPISWLSNHSCDPNMGFNNKGDMVLIKNVKAGEELTQDYGFSVTDPKCKMRCRCGSKNCRKIITGNDWKNPEFFKKNKKYMNV